MIEEIEDVVGGAVALWERRSPRTRLIVMGSVIGGLFLSYTVATTMTAYLLLDASRQAGTYQLLKQHNQSLIVDLAERRSIDHLRIYARRGGYVAIGPVTYAP